MRSETGRQTLPGRLLAGLLTCLIAAGTAACASGGADEASDGSDNRNAATVEQVAGSDTPRITLSDEAVERIGVVTDPVGVQVSGDVQQLTIPYRAVIYDAQGQAFTYVSPSPHVYTRVPLTIDQVQGDIATLDAGPAAGTAVVTTGAEELWGTETGVGGED
jgi:hypothetical protein